MEQVIPSSHLMYYQLRECICMCAIHDLTGLPGQFQCGNKRCEKQEGLKSWEVNFAYVEHGEKRNALVKLSKPKVKLSFHFPLVILCKKQHLCMCGCQHSMCVCVWGGGFGLVGFPV